MLRIDGWIEKLYKMYFNFSMLFRLLPKTFSGSRGSLRFPSGKRIGMVLLIFPLFTIVFLVNWTFLLLDEIFFPHYRFKKITKSVFIVGVPRTATTFLLESLSADHAAFTGFRLWELVLAPSIIQKYFFAGLLYLDRFMGKPLRRTAALFDKLVFGNFRNIHNMGLGRPEEDEVLLLWCFSSAYLGYFFPEVAASESLIFFDETLTLKKRKHIMRFYYRCVQRHQFVFNRKNEKYFLSKNPTFTGKLNSIRLFFPEAKLLYTLRTPYRTIPATISLNASIYSAFSKLPEKYPLKSAIKAGIIRLYKMADNALKSWPPAQQRIVPFNLISRNPETELKHIYVFLGLPVTEKTAAAFNAIQVKANQYKSGHRYNTNTETDELEIKTELDFIINGPYSNDIG